ncbi:MAG: hypothetical protein M3024_05985 [Candidatus Dormibacteraeota bacterium]|nr:hypothetical protein [Candidatus Dormibacteraeota bacterium]
MAKRPGTGVPWLPITILGVFLVVFIALVVWYRATLPTAGGGAVTGQPVANVHCDTGEQLAVHYHAHLTILYRGTPVTVPAQTGILSTCFYWLHTHDTTGVIHIEAPQSSATRVFTLGDFFHVWGQPLSTTQVATFKVGSGDQLKMWVDGAPYTGDPSQIPLKSHRQIVLQIGPPFQDPPPTFTWPSNLGQ